MSERLDDLIKQKERIEIQINQLKSEEENHKKSKLQSADNIINNVRVFDKLCDKYKKNQVLEVANELIEYDKRFQNAMEYLIKYRVPFNHKDDFIHLANQHATNKICDSFLKRPRGSDIGFCDCGYWGGYSNRCSCNNVRCMWVWDDIEFDDKNAFKNMNFRVEPY